MGFNSGFKGLKRRPNWGIYMIVSYPFTCVFAKIILNYIELYWIHVFYPTAFFVLSGMLAFEHFFMFMGTGQNVSATFRYSITTIITADAHTLTASSRLNWRPRRFKWTRPFRRKTKSCFCACAVTFQTQSTILSWYSPIFVKASYSLEDFVCLCCFKVYVEHGRVLLTGENRSTWITVSPSDTRSTTTPHGLAWDWTCAFSVVSPPIIRSTSSDTGQTVTGRHCYPSTSVFPRQ